jgi:sucrose-6-phosphate hydrolase SacC (GH32 family)
VLTDSEQWSLVVVVNWEDDSLQWLKARAAAVLSLGTKRSFADLYSAADGQLIGRNGGSAALDAVHGGRDDGTVAMRVLVDGSAVEVFTSTGQVASTRVYAGNGAARRLAAVSDGGSTRVSGAAWTMGSIWL